MAKQCAPELAAVMAERDEFKERLRQTELNLVLANRTKSEFLKTMSHELRTPLNAIIGFAEILLDPEMPMDQEHQKQALENIRNSGWHLLRLINEILDLSKVDIGRMELNPEEFSLTDALRGVHAIVKPLAEKRLQKLVLILDAPTMLAYHDVGRFKQAIYNLLSNAIKFTPEGGQITISACVTPDDWIEVLVADTGIGIRPEDQERIFEAFQQVEGGYARTQPGSGVGLSLVRSFARLMGGDITLHSAPNRGSTFTLRLPLRQSEALKKGADI